MANSVEFSCYGSAWICLRHYKRHSCYLILSLPLALIVAPLHATCLLVPSVLLSMSSLTASHLNSGDLDVTVNFLTEIDRLVQMIESPIFTRKFRLAAALPCALDPNSYCYAIWYQLAGACLFFLFLSFLVLLPSVCDAGVLPMYIYFSMYSWTLPVGALYSQHPSPQPNVLWCNEKKNPVRILC